LPVLQGDYTVVGVDFDKMKLQITNA
jgi:hypothetical protein